jgi:hypothetical protein
MPAFNSPQEWTPARTGLKREFGFEIVAKIARTTKSDHFSVHSSRKKVVTWNDLILAKKKRKKLHAFVQKEGQQDNCVSRQHKRLTSATFILLRLVPHAFVFPFASPIRDVWKKASLLVVNHLKCPSAHCCCCTSAQQKLSRTRAQRASQLERELGTRPLDE